MNRIDPASTARPPAVPSARRPPLLPPVSLLPMLPLRNAIERRAASLSTLQDGFDEDFSQPAGEPSLLPPDSVSWQVFRNPVGLLIGGIAAVLLELAEPRVRSGVYEHSSFRRDPMARLRRTGRATMVTVYGAESRAKAMIDRVSRMHRPLGGITPGGQPYRADDPELLDWVCATASFGFLRARDAYVRPIGADDQDRFYREGQRAAALYGAEGAPRSRAEMERLMAAMRPRLEPSPLLHEFLDVMRRLPLLPPFAAPLQRGLVAAAVQLVPGEIRARLGLEDEPPLQASQRVVIRTLARCLDRLPLRTGAPVRACRRLGLPDDFLHRRAWEGECGAAETPPSRHDGRTSV